MVMMHDFNVTENYVVFMDLPVCFDLAALETGLPFKFDRDAGARLGVLPRHGTNADIRWFDIDPCYVFHPVNAHEDGNTLVLHVSRQPEAFGSSNDDYAEVGRLWRWTIDLDRRHRLRGADRRSAGRLRARRRSARRARRASTAT